MASDIEMDGRRQSRTPDFPFPPPSGSASAATSRRSSLAVGNDVKGIAVTNGHNRGGSSSQGPISIPVLVHSPSPAPSTEAVPLRTSLPPPATTAAKPLSSSSKPVSTAKPKSTKPAKARSPSPSPPPPPTIIPLNTIRLEIRLGGPSNYEVDISHRAKETGQRPPTPPPVVQKVADSSESEEEEDGKPKDDKSKPKKKKRKNHVSEYYDTSDPFIDDSELALDERQFFAQTKQQGFYVSSGEVALLKDKTPKKPKSKKVIYGLHPSLGGTGTEKKAHPPEGTRDAPIPVDDDSKRHHLSLTMAAGADPQHAGQKRKRQNTVIAENGKRKKVVDESLFHPELQAAILELKQLIAKESWEVKGKFPAGLKPHLAKIAIVAIRLDEYDDDFFSLMPTMFPYNKFTMTKLIKRTVYPDHLALLHERESTLMGELADLAQKGFAKAEEEWEKSVIAWDKRKEKGRTDAGDASGSAAEAAPTRHPTEEMDVDGPAPTQADGEGKDGKESHPPAKRYRLTDQMKAIIWELVLLSNECVRLENEKNTLEGSVIQISDQGARKNLYQKIVAAYPEGWMTSGQISRDMSAIKKRLEREAMEQENDE